MKQIVVLLSSLLICVASYGQRSIEIVQDRNFWLTADNAAALTTMQSSNISAARLFYDYNTGDLKGDLQGKTNNEFGAEVKSYTRLSPKAVLAGSISYNNISFTEAAGSMLIPTTELQPFDIVELTDENAGDKRLERFNVAGSAGFNVYRGLSVGGSVDFTAGSYAKFKDLRHVNSLMYLDTRVGVFYSPGGQNGVGASMIYRRRTESINFETFGTTDKTFHSLIDYANGMGQTETFGGEGFTDNSHELPLFSEFIGIAVDGGYRSLFVSVNYQRRNGYYGRRSQYTVGYSTNTGDFFNCRIRYKFPQNRRSLCLLDFNLTSQMLSTYRTNYRKETMPENPAVSFYKYYASTRMSDKATNHATINLVGHWKPDSEIYLWNTSASIGYHWMKQTAYLFPQYYTEKIKTVTFDITGRRNFIFKNRSLAWIGANFRGQVNNLDYISAGCDAGYEFAIKSSAVRPYVSLQFDIASGIKSPISHQKRHDTQISLGVTF